MDTQTEAKTKLLDVKTICLLLIIAALVLALAVTNSRAGQDKTVATVNGEKLTQAELYTLMYDQVGSQTTETLINKTLVFQEGKKKGLTVTADDIEAELKVIKDAWGVSSDQELEQMLAMQGTTLNQLKEQIEMWCMVRDILAPTVTVSDAETQKYFNEHQDQYGSPEQVKARHILVDTEAEATAILKDLQNGADFAALAKEKSKDTASKSSGGDLGFIGKGQMVAPFEEAAFALDKGEMSGVVQSEFGYHIIQVTDKKAAVKADYQKVKADVEKTLIDQKVQEKYPTWLENLRKQAKIQYVK